MRPQLVLLAGLPGAGKSTLARALTERFDWVHLDRDQLRSQRIDEPNYSQREKTQLNRWLLADTRRWLLKDRTVIVDGMTFARRPERRLFAGLAQGLFLDSVWLWLDLSAERAKIRVAHDSAHQAADRSPLIVDQVSKRFASPEDPWHRIDASQTPNEVLEQACRFIAR